MDSMDTIAAVATAMSNSGIGIVRISGSEAVAVADKLFRAKNQKKRLEEVESHTVHYGFVYDGEELIDEVLVLVMRAPNSYTAEDTVEIDCHGGTVVMERILRTVVRNGARPAQPGEFTKRAFLNGRIDLSRAEAVVDVIQSKNEYALKNSLKQLRGLLYEEIKSIRESLLYEIAFIESALDDPEHISLEGYPSMLENKVKQIFQRLEKLLASSKNGKILKEGINTVIVGKPNAGKSSLMNIMAGEEKAIVTDIAGTTRDVLEESISINGIGLNIIDTAGIRSTQDKIEKIGVDKARRYAKEADLIVYMADASVKMDESDDEIMELIREKKSIVLLNKTDLEMVVSERDVEDKLKNNGIEDYHILSVSAKEQKGIEDFVKTVKDMFLSRQVDTNDEMVITNIRQAAAIQEAADSMENVRKSIEDGMSEDFYSIDLMGAYTSLGAITGEEAREDLINEIFEKFCMGK